MPRLAILWSSSIDTQYVSRSCSVVNNEFIQLVEKARELNWCTRIHCTTCGNGEFRKSLNEMGDGIGFQLAQALADLNVTEYVTLKNWDDCLRIALLHLSFPGQLERVLKSWLSGVDKNLRFADVVLFYVVRALPSGDELRIAWISACMNLAAVSKDTSLIESLVWVLGSDLPHYHELLDLAKHLSATSLNVKKAMIETGNST